jgi:hypothetical protein
MDFLFSLLFFKHSPYLSSWHMKLWRERNYEKLNGVIIWWMEKCMFCATLSARVGNIICRCTCVSIMGAWQQFQLRSQQFNKVQCSNK